VLLPIKSRKPTKAKWLRKTGYVYLTVNLDRVNVPAYCLNLQTSASLSVVAHRPNMRSDVLTGNALLVSKEKGKGTEFLVYWLET
jgi:hypothetical protein